MDNFLGARGRIGARGGVFEKTILTLGLYLQNECLVDTPDINKLPLD